MGTNGKLHRTWANRPSNNKTVTAIAFMESIKRLSIGDSDGRIHLLDLAMKRKINIIQSLLTDGIKKKILKSWMLKVRNS